MQSQNDFKMVSQYTYRSIIDATCVVNTDLTRGVAYDYSTNAGHEYLMYDYQKPCTDTTVSGGKCDSTSVVPAQTGHAATNLVYAYTSTYGAEALLNNGGKIGLVYDQATAQSTEELSSTQEYQEWVKSDGTVYTQTTQALWLGEPVSNQAGKGDFETGVAWACNLKDSYTLANVVDLGCKDPSDAVYCEFDYSGYSPNSDLYLEFASMFSTSLACDIDEESLFFSSAVDELQQVQIGGQDVKRYNWWSSDSSFVSWADRASPQEWEDQFPAVHHPNVTKDKTGFSVLCRPRTTTWQTLESFEFYVIALVPDSGNQYMSVIEGNRMLKINFTPWGDFKSSDLSYELLFTASAFQSISAQSGGLFQYRWDLMTKTQADASTDYQNLPAGYKFPYFDHEFQSGSLLVKDCNCDPIKLEVFTNSAMTLPLELATYTDLSPSAGPTRRRLTTTGSLITVFAVSQHGDNSSTPYVDITLDLSNPEAANQQEIYIKVTDNLGAVLKQHMKFSLCGAETLGDFETPKEDPLEYNMYSTPDSRFEFVPIWRSTIASYYDLNSAAASDSCAVNYYNMYTDDACSNEYDQASNDGTVINHFIERYYYAEENKHYSMIVLHSVAEYGPKVYYIKLRTNGEVESICKAFTFQILFVCPQIYFDYSYTAETYYYEYDTGVKEISLTPFLEYLKGLEDSRCGLDENLAFLIKKRKSSATSKALADLGHNDVEEISWNTGSGYLALSSWKWADKATLKLTMDSSNAHFINCIAIFNNNKQHGNCSQSVLVQFYSSNNRDKVPAFIELSFNLYAPEIVVPEPEEKPCDPIVSKCGNTTDDIITDNNKTDGNDTVIDDGTVDDTITDDKDKNDTVTDDVVVEEKPVVIEEEVIDDEKKDDSDEEEEVFDASKFMKIEDEEEDEHHHDHEEEKDEEEVEEESELEQEEEEPEDEDEESEDEDSEEEEEEDEVIELDEDEQALLEEAMASGVFEEEAPAEEDGPPKAKAVGPVIPEWQTIADEGDVLAFLASLQQEESDDEEDEEEEKDKGVPRPIKMVVSKISRDGKVNINFNQQMKIPPFEEFLGSRRSLSGVLRMADLNVQRDIVDITFDLRSGVPKSALKYSLQITQWTERGIEISMNFSNPEAVSQGNFRDGVSIKIKNVNWFKAAGSDEVLKLENAEIKESFPKQVPKSMDAQKLEENAKEASSSMTAVIIIQIILQVVLKGSMDDIWNMYLILQLCAYMSIYDIPFPVNVEIYVQQFRSLIRFEILKPDNILSFIDPDLSVDVLIGASKSMVKSNMESSGFKSADFMRNMAVYIFAIVAGLLVIIGMLFLRFFDKIQPKIDKALRNAANKFFFNNYVRSITITYLETAISFKIMCETTGFNAPLFMQLTLFPICCGVALLKFRTRLDEPAIRERMEKMYVNISMKKSMREPQMVLYYPVFMIRRFIFVVVPLFLTNMVVGGKFQTRTYGSLQLYALIFLSSLYIIQYGILQPHDQPKLIKMELFNESLFMILNYHMFFYTKFLDQHPLYNFEQGKVSNKAGWSYLGFLVIVAVVNVGNLAGVIAKNYSRMQRLKRRKVVILKQDKMNKAIFAELSRQGFNLRPMKSFSIKTQPDCDIADLEKLESRKQAKTAELKKQRSRDEILGDLEREIENIIDDMENQKQEKPKKQRPRRNTEAAINLKKELRLKIQRQMAEQLKKKKLTSLKLNHLDTIKEEDSKLVDSDIMQGRPDLSMSLVEYGIDNMNIKQKDSRSKKRKQSKSSIANKSPFATAVDDDMEKMMLEIEMMAKSEIREKYTDSKDTEVDINFSPAASKSGSQSIHETQTREATVHEERSINTPKNNGMHTEEPRITQVAPGEIDDKGKRRSKLNTQIKTIVALKQHLRKRKNIKY